VIRFLVEIWESFNIALRSLSTNRLRSGLTMLGIIIGIVTVTAMITIINGLENAMDNSLALLGTNAYMSKRPIGLQNPTKGLGNGLVQIYVKI